ncbi:MAG: DUF2523 domain-containing protein [Candidatus Accumulibacter sp.]|jgi:hypothetical protein|nr:DUF2523 domain-containing protein [Accumulibacter sp.]
MPAFLIPAICGALVTITASVVGRVLLALSLGFVSYTGINIAVDIFKQDFINALGNAGYGLIGIAGLLQVDVVMSIYIAAGLARLAINGANGGTIKRLAFK